MRTRHPYKSPILTIVMLSPTDVICDSCQVEPVPDNCGDTGGDNIFPALLSEDSIIQGSAFQDSTVR